MKTATIGFLLLAMLLGPPNVRSEPIIVAGEAVWSGKIVVDEVAAVAADATLTILPGTEVRFRKGGSEGGLLVVYGRLLALGTAEAPILFRSAEANPRAGDWQGIYFEEGKNRENLLRHCRIEHARTAIGGVRSRVTLVDTALCGNQTAYRGGNELRGTLQACEIVGNEAGVELVKSGPTEIRNCRIAGNRGTGIFCQGASPRIAGNRIEENGVGILCRNEVSSAIEENRIRNNRVGIQAERQVAPVLRHNEIVGNDTGVWLEKMAFPVLEKNLIRENRVGIYCNLSGYPRLAGNNIIENREYALDLGPKQSIVVSRQRPARQKDGGLAASGVVGTGAYRKNRPEEIAPSFPADDQIDARCNWWGEAPLAELTAKGGEANLTFIEDGYDQPVAEFDGQKYPRDRFAYAPWATAPIPDAGLSAPSLPE